MVNAKDRVFCVYGAQAQGRKLIIDNLKNKIFKGDITHLSVITFYPKEIEIKDLQEKVLLSSFSRDKLLIFKDSHSLPKEVKDFLFNNFNKIISNNYIIFEAENAPSQSKKITADKFFNFITSSASCYGTSSLHKASFSFDDFKRSLRQNNKSEAIYILSKLFEDRLSEGEKKSLGLQVLGILISEFSYLKNNALRKKYFNYLWDADRAIKEKGLEPRFALELFLSKL